MWRLTCVTQTHLRLQEEPQPPQKHSTSHPYWQPHNPRLLHLKSTRTAPEHQPLSPHILKGTPRTTGSIQSQAAPLHTHCIHSPRTPGSVISHPPFQPQNPSLCHLSPTFPAPEPQPLSPLIHLSSPRTPASVTSHPPFQPQNPSLCHLSPTFPAPEPQPLSPLTHLSSPRTPASPTPVPYLPALPLTSVVSVAVSCPSVCSALVPRSRVCVQMSHPGCVPCPDACSRSVSSLYNTIHLSEV